MTIWNSKSTALLGLMLLLGACDSALESTGGLLAAIAPPEDVALPAVPLTQALMVRGQVTLVPPSGYCIDPESLSQSFALMGPCDAMGATTGGSGGPAGVMTVSIARSAKDAPLPSAAQIADALSVSTPQEIRETADWTIFKTTSTTPRADLALEHWRGVAKVGRFTIGAALFGPEGRRAASAEGASVLEDMLKRTLKETNAG